MTARDVFCFLAGALAACTAVPMLLVLHRSAKGRGTRAPVRALGYIALGAVPPLVISVAIYARLGAASAISIPGARAAPSVIGAPSPSDGIVSNTGSSASAWDDIRDAAAPHLPSAAGSPVKAGSLEDDTTRLAARLARGGGSAADWQLLAESYEFLGRAQDARDARARAAVAASAR